MRTDNEKTSGTDALQSFLERKASEMTHTPRVRRACQAEHTQLPRETRNPLRELLQPPLAAQYRIPSGEYGGSRAISPES